MSLATMTLNEEAEQKLVEGIFWNAVDVLSEDDCQLPQITNALPMLKRGVAVHHSGLLPIVKEVIEILFQEGLIKVCGVFPPAALQPDPPRSDPPLKGGTLRMIVCACMAQRDCWA